MVRAQTSPGPGSDRTLKHYIYIFVTCSYMQFIILGVDPHQDKPIEVLHVILLGFIKYFWCDLIRKELGDNDDKKQLLIQCLSSLDVSGLNISPLNGKTLVQYAGSLTGRDSRHITQAAPFVIYNLVTPECYNAWISLSKLVPLIWQPGIKDIEKHIVSQLHYHTQLERFLRSCYRIF